MTNRPLADRAMALPSLSLIAQSVLSGVFVGALYGLLGLGLSLSWGLLRQINLAHFALAFLGAYLCYQLSTVGGIDPLLTLALIVPGFFVARRRACSGCFARFEISAVQLAARHVRADGHRRVADPVDLDRGFPAARVGVRQRQASSSASLYVPRAGAADAGVSLVAVARASGRRCATPTSARRCARPPRMAPIAAAFGVNRQPLALAALRRLRRARGRGRRVHRAVATRSRRRRSTVDRRRVRRGDDGRPRAPARPARRRHRHRRQRVGDDGAHLAVVGAARVVLAAHRRAAGPAGDASAC